MRRSSVISRGDFVNYKYSKIQTFPAKVLEVASNGVLIEFIVIDKDENTRMLKDVVELYSLSPREFSANHQIA